MVYRNGGGSNITGLTNGSTYYVINISADRIKLAKTRSDAMRNNLISNRAIDISTGAATGTNHSLSRLVGGTATAVTSTMNSRSRSSLVSSATGLTGTAAVSGTVAFIGSNATVNAGDDINVRADDKIDFTVLVGGVTAGLGAAGGSVAIVNIGQRTEAYIATGANITAGSAATDDILVHAKLDLDVNGRAYAGSFSLAGSVAAQAVVLRDTSVQAAYIEDNANILRAGGEVTVEAFGDRNASVQTIGGAVSSGVAIGASIAIADLRGSTTAEVRGSNIGQTAAIVRALDVRADNKSLAKANAIAVGGGIVGAGSAAVARADVAPAVTAAIAANSDVRVSEDITIDGLSSNNADVDATGISVAGTGAVGAAVAFASLAPVMLVAVGGNSRVQGRSLRQRALHNIGSDGRRQANGALADAIAGAGAAFGGAAGADADASVNPTMNAVISPASTVTMSGNVSILSLAYNDANANGTGVGIGVLKAGAGAAFADANISGIGRARIDGAAVTSTSGTVEITSDWFHDADATVISGAGGFYFAASGNRASAVVTSDVDSFVQGTSVVNAGDDVNIFARAAGTVDATATGVSVGAGVAVGVSIANADMRPNVDAYVSAGSISATDDVSIQALSNVTTDGLALPNQGAGQGESVGWSIGRGERFRCGCDRVGDCECFRQSGCHHPIDQWRCAAGRASTQFGRGREYGDHGRLHRCWRCQYRRECRRSDECSDGWYGVERANVVRDRPVISYGNR